VLQPAAAAPKLKRRVYNEPPHIINDYNYCPHTNTLITQLLPPYKRASRGVESIAVPNDGGAEGCRSCLGWYFQSTGAWWVKDMPVSLRRTWANCRTLQSDDVRGASCTVWLNIEKAVEISRLFYIRHAVKPITYIHISRLYMRSNFALAWNNRCACSFTNRLLAYVEIICQSHNDTYCLALHIPLI